MIRLAICVALAACAQSRNASAQPHPSSTVVSSPDGRFHYTDAEDGHACVTALTSLTSQAHHVTVCFESRLRGYIAMGTFPRGWYLTADGTRIELASARIVMTDRGFPVAGALVDEDVARLGYAETSVCVCYRSRCFDITGAVPFFRALTDFAIANYEAGRG